MSGGMNIALEAAEDDDVTNANVGDHFCVRTDGETASRQSDGPLDVAIHVKVLLAGEFSANNDGFTDNGGTLCLIHRLFSRNAFSRKV